MVSTLALLAFYLFSMPATAETDDELMQQIANRKSSVEDRSDALRRLDRQIHGQPDRLVKQSAMVFRLFEEGDPIIANNSEWLLASGGTKIIPTLLEGLRSPNLSVQIYSARAFGVMQPGEKKIAADELETRLLSGPRDGKCGAALALSVLNVSTATIGEIQNLTAVAIAPDIKACAYRAFAYGNLNVVPAIDDIIRGTHDADQNVAHWAIMALARAGPVAQEAATRLLKDSHGADRTAAAIAAARVGATDPEILPALIEGLHSPEGGLRYQSLEAIVSMRKAGAPAIPDIKPLIEDSMTQIRCEAYQALYSVGGVTVDLLPKFTAEIERRGPCAVYAVSMLRTLGPEAAAAVPLLVANIHGDMSSSPDQSTEVLVKIGSASISGLLPLLSDADPYRRRWAVSGLSRLAQYDRRIVPGIARLTDDPVYLVRWEVFRALGDLGPIAKIAARSLFEQTYLYETINVGAEQALARMLPLSLEELHPKVPFQGLEAEIRFPKKQFSHNEAIAYTIEFKNHTGNTIRVLNPVCGGPWGNTDPYIVREPGFIYQSRHTFADSSMYGISNDASPDISIELAPNATHDFACGIQDAEKGPDNRFPAMYIYHPIGAGAPPETSPHHLPPGKYHIRVHYRMSDPDHKRGWDSAHSRRYGSPWSGQVLSNEATFAINP